MSVYVCIVRHMTKNPARTATQTATEADETESALITITETAHLLGLSLQALQVRIYRGTFPLHPVRYTPTGKRYYRRTDVEDFIDGQH